MNHRINKSNHKTILSLLIPTLTITILSGVYTAPTHADTPASSSSSANASITVSNTINLTLTGGDLVINNLTPGSASDSNIITATITSNSPYGYHLSATTGTSTGTTSLVNTADSNFSFTSLSANKATLNDFSDNTWGYSYSTDNGTTWISGDYGTALSGYNGLTLDNDDSGATGTTLFNNDSYAGSTAVKFKIGAKSSSTQAAGTYTGTVNFYAVTNPKPIVTFDMAYADAGKEKLNGYYKMQDASALICSAVDTGQNGQLIDIRDNQVYNVAKLADNKCWMVENLNITAGTRLSSSNTDYETTYNLPNTNGWVVDNDELVLPNSDVSYFTVGYEEYAALYNSENKVCDSNPCYSYYSWDTATLGSGRQIAIVDADAPYSICPKNWRLPNTRTGIDSSSDYRALMIAYGGNSSDSEYDSSTNPSGETMFNRIGDNSFPSFTRSGFYNNNQFNNGGNAGYYASSTSNSNRYGLQGLLLSRINLYSAYSLGRYFGLSVRCLFSGQ